MKSVGIPYLQDQYSAQTRAALQIIIDPQVGSAQGCLILQKGQVCRGSYWVSLPVKNAATAAIHHVLARWMHIDSGTGTGGLKGAGSFKSSVAVVAFLVKNYSLYPSVLAIDKAKSKCMQCVVLGVVNVDFEIHGKLGNGFIIEILLTTDKNCHTDG
jgi:hypothetical protein